MFKMQVIYPVLHQGIGKDHAMWAPEATVGSQRSYDLSAHELIMMHGFCL